MQLSFASLLASIATTLTLAAGCGTSVQTTPLNAAPRAMSPRPPATVELFTSGPPSRPHIDVALLEAEQESSLSVDRTPEMLAALRERGAAMGCDAVVVGGLTSRDPGLPDGETFKGVYATCLVYTSAGDTLATSGQ